MVSQVDSAKNLLPIAQAAGSASATVQALDLRELFTSRAQRRRRR